MGTKEGKRIWKNRRGTESTQDWAKTKHRHIYTHHEHHKTSKDIGKVNIESIRSASGMDSWHDRNGYRSIKAIEGFLHHPTHGQIAYLIIDFHVNCILKLFPFAILGVRLLVGFTCPIFLEFYTLILTTLVTSVF